jgi:excisionase family DNA binding protein
MTDHRMLTTREAAEYLHVKYRALGENWHKWGLTAYQVGKRNMFRVSELDRFLQDHATKKPRGRVA